METMSICVQHSDFVAVVDAVLLSTLLGDIFCVQVPQLFLFTYLDKTHSIAHTDSRLPSTSLEGINGHIWLFEPTSTNQTQEQQQVLLAADPSPIHRQSSFISLIQLVFLLSFPSCFFYLTHLSSFLLSLLPSLFLNIFF